MQTFQQCFNRYTSSGKKHLETAATLESALAAVSEMTDFQVMNFLATHYLEIHEVYASIDWTRVYAIPIELGAFQHDCTDEWELESFLYGQRLTPPVARKLVVWLLGY